MESNALRKTWKCAIVLLVLAGVFWTPTSEPNVRANTTGAEQEDGDSDERLADSLTPPSASLALNRSTVVDPEALHLSTPSWNTTINGTAFQQAALASHGNWQYATWWDADRRLCIGRRHHTEDQWHPIRFEDYRIEGNDTHNVSVLGISANDGVIHLSFDHHGHPLRYRKSRPGAAHLDDSSAWTAELFGPVVHELEPGKRIEGVTYPRFIHTPNGDLQLFFRVGGSGNGDWVLADYDPQNGWSTPRMIFSRSGLYGMSPSRCAYFNGIAYDTTGRLHTTWVWRESGDAMRNHDLNYATSDDRGTVWKDTHGNDVAVAVENPISINTPGIRFQRLDMYRGLMNSTTQVVDSKGRVHTVTFHLPDETTSQMNWEHTRNFTRYMHYWRDLDGTWHRNETHFNGTRPQVFADRHDNLYLVFTGDRYVPDRDLVIIAANAADHWSHWSEIYRRPGPFTGQPQLDRYRGTDTMAVYLQEYPENPESDRSPLWVFEFNVGKKDY